MSRCGCASLHGSKNFIQKVYFIILGGMKMVKKQEFEVTLLKPPDIDGAYFIVPFNVPEVYGTKAHVKVRGTIDGFPYRGLIANMGEGHCMVVKKEIRQAIGKSAGNRVKVVMEIDTEP